MDVTIGSTAPDGAEVAAYTEDQVIPGHDRAVGAPAAEGSVSDGVFDLSGLQEGRTYLVVATWEDEDGNEHSAATTISAKEPAEVDDEAQEPAAYPPPTFEGLAVMTDKERELTEKYAAEAEEAEEVDPATLAPQPEPTSPPTPEPEEATEEVTEEEATDLSDLTVAELRDLADANDVELASSDNKGDVIAKLEDAGVEAE